MPFIEEDKFKLMQEDLDNAKLKREEAENELIQSQEEFISFKKKSRITPIILGLLLGAALGAAYYFYSNSGGISFTPANDVASIKKSENIRVLDSIKRAHARAKRNNISSNDNNENSLSNDNLKNTASNVKSNTSGNTIYSVQIGVFSKKRYPLLSSKTIPSTVTNTDRYFKYSIGLFSTLNEARKLKKELIKVGFKDAFVASYVDGKRQKIHQ